MGDSEGLLEECASLRAVACLSAERCGDTCGWRKRNDPCRNGFAVRGIIQYRYIQMILEDTLDCDPKKLDQHENITLFTVPMHWQELDK